MKLYHFTRSEKYPMLSTPLQVFVSAPDQVTAEDMVNDEPDVEYLFDWNIVLIGNSYIEQKVLFIEMRFY